MVTDVFPVDVSYVVPESLQQRVLVTAFGQGQEKRKKMWDNPKRSFAVNMRTLSNTDADLLRAFWIARGGAFEPFSFLPPLNHDRLVTGIACGTGDAVETVFQIQNTLTPPYYYRIFTGTGNRNAVYKDATPQGSGFTLANDDTNFRSTITFDTAPADGVVITCDIDRYMIGRFSTDAGRIDLTAFAALNSDLEILEVLRASI